MTQVELQYFEGCPNWRLTASHLAQLATEFPAMTVTLRPIESEAEAARAQFHGSPSLRINGVDPFADPDTAVALACRLYRTPNGTAGSPTADMLREALRAATGQDH